MISMVLMLVFASPPSLSNAQTAEISRVEKRLLAPCCYTQSIAQHGSDIAVQMRKEVAEMVADGKPDEEIVDRYRNIYGDRILIVPDGLTGRILFSLPVAISLLACLVLLLCFRKMLRSESMPRYPNVPPLQNALSDTLREKIEREIGDSA